MTIAAKIQLRYKTLPSARNNFFTKKHVKHQ